MKQIGVSLLIIIVTITGNAQNIILVKNINLVDITKGKIVPNTTVVIRDDKIEQVAPSRRVKDIDGATIVDGTDKYLMPGMIDTHIHFFQSGSIYTRPDAIDLRHKMPTKEEDAFTFGMVPDSFSRYLRLGITSIMDVGGPFQNFVVRDSVAAQHLSPNVYVTGSLFSSYVPENLRTDDPPIVEVKSIEEADELFDKMMAFKPDFIKIWYIVTSDSPAEKTFPIFQHVAQRTHDNNLKLTVHATQLNTAKLAVEAGADILVHSVTNEVVDDEFINLLIDNNVALIPTLVVSGGYGRAMLSDTGNHPQDLYWANSIAFGSLLEFTLYNEEDLPQRIARIRKAAENYRKTRARSDSIMAINLKKLWDAGVNIMTGTDAGNIGTMHASSYIQEQEAMQMAGLTITDILKASTINAAKGFGLEETLGIIEKGKIADLLILERNPLESLDNLNSTNMVIKSGILVEADALVKESPEAVVQRQVNAYNARNIDVFMDTYAEDIQLFSYSGKMISKGQEAMRDRYGKMFEATPNLYCQVQNRIVQGNKVIDKEYVRVGDSFINAVAIYEVENGKIAKVTFMQ